MLLDNPRHARDSRDLFRGNFELQSVPSSRMSETFQRSSATEIIRDAWNQVTRKGQRGGIKKTME